MATYTKETALYDTNAIADDISAAGETASKFLSADSSGIMIYDGTNGAQTPSSPAATTRNVFIDDDSVDVRLGATTLATFGAETTIGEDGKARLVFGSSEMYGITDKSIESFRISGDGTTEEAIADSSKVFYLTNTSYRSWAIPDSIPLTSGTVFSVGYYRAVSNNNYSTIGTISCTAGSTYSKTFTVDTYNYYIGYDGDRTINVQKSPIQVATESWKNSVMISVEIPVTTSSPYFVFGRRQANTTLGAYSFSIGKTNVEVSGNYSFGAGQSITASGNFSHAEGRSAYATGDYSFATGYMVQASNEAAHAEGYETDATGKYSHAEGTYTTASHTGAHAEGSHSTASGAYSHAEGSSSKAIGNCSHAQNENTIAQGLSQTAIGRWNIANGTYNSISSNEHCFIIGNGSNNTSRSNALTVDWAGNVDIASGAKYKINGTALAASDVGAVPTTRKVNNKALSADITLSASDVSAVPTTRKVNNKALSADITLSAADVSAVPTTRTVNSKALSADITLSASDVSAVPTTRTVNSKALSADITLTAADVSAVPTTRTVNSKALSADITLSASDVGALATSKIQGGHETFNSIATNSYADKTITFNPAFAAAPNMVATLSTSGTAGNIGNVTVSVFDISKTGATIRVFNNRGGALSPAVEWIAIDI